MWDAHVDHTFGSVFEVAGAAARRLSLVPRALGRRFTGTGQSRKTWWARWLRYGAPVITCRGWVWTREAMARIGCLVRSVVRQLMDGHPMGAYTWVSWQALHATR